MQIAKSVVSATLPERAVIEFASGAHFVVSCGAEVADETILGHYHGSLRSLLVGGLWVKAFILNCQQTTSWAVALK